MTDTARSRAILSTASRLFAEKGYSNATTSEIAREAGVAEGTLYHHFGSKDGIFLTLFDETIDGFLAGIGELLARGTTGREALAALARFLFDYVSRHHSENTGPESARSLVCYHLVDVARIFERV